MKTKYMTPAEVEQEFKIKKGTLANWRSQGRGPSYIKCGRKVLYSAEKFVEWLESNKVLTEDSLEAYSS